MSLGFPRQKYWNGSPFPPPGDIPDLGIEPTSPALAGGMFTTELPGDPNHKEDDKWLGQLKVFASIASFYLSFNLYTFLPKCTTSSF